MSLLNLASRSDKVRHPTLSRNLQRTCRMALRLSDLRVLTTQLYLQGNTGGFWSRVKREPLQINPKLKQNGQYETEFNFIV